MASGTRAWRPRTSPARWLLIGVSALILLFVALPTLIVVPVSLSATEYLSFPPQELTLHWYQEFLTDPDWIRATLLSFQIAVVVAVLSVVIGTMAALAMVRGLGGSGWLSVIAAGPLII